MAGVGRRFGAPTTTRTAAPTAMPTAAAKSRSGTPDEPASAMTTSRTTTAMSAARRHGRDSQTLPTAVAAAAPDT